MAKQVDMNIITQAENLKNILSIGSTIAQIFKLPLVISYDLTSFIFNVIRGYCIKLI